MTPFPCNLVQWCWYNAPGGILPLQPVTTGCCAAGNRPEAQRGMLAVRAGGPVIKKVGQGGSAGGIFQISADP